MTRLWAGWSVPRAPAGARSYTIRGGINSIGRSDRMDITITGDRTISQENHARLSYSSKNNRFHLLPGDGRNIVYLNGDEVFSPMPLKAYDLIDFGDTSCCSSPCAASSSPGRPTRRRTKWGCLTDCFAAPAAPPTPR